MFVAGDFNNSITHKTKVSSVKDNIVTLSNACVIPDSTKLIFIENRGCTQPFSLSIPSSGSGTVYKKDESNINFNDVIGGIREVIQHNVNGATSASTTIALDSTKGIIPGMKVTGNGITPQSGSTEVTVSTITKVGIVVDAAQSIADDVLLSFAHPRDSSTLFKDGNNVLGLTQIQSTITDGALKVEGYLEIEEINTTSTLRLYVDELAIVN